MQIVPLFWGYSIREDSMVLNPKNRILNQFLNSAGYYSVNITDPRGNQHMYQIHRLMAIKFVYNPVGRHIFPLVDHIDRNCTNNDFLNLRWVNRTLNNLNNDADGCSFDKRYKKWRARVCKKTLGYFKKHEDAKACAKKYRKELFDEIYHKLCHENHERCENTRSPSLIFFSENPKTDCSPILSY